MPKAVAVRLHETGYIALRWQAERLRLRPGILAFMLVHAGLSESAPSPERSKTHAAFDQLVQHSRQLASVGSVPPRTGGIPTRLQRNTVKLVNEFRVDLGTTRLMSSSTPTCW
ncbi:hypothetical protein MUBE_06975 [Mycobacterium uberis]|uniref:Uncharacterized protein n=1 Tax=Mycobacterium uberis TaxID=2162698 RepID=A0A3E1HHL1_9MYCO|nr:hypothetical protein [Mycobacterium uberis]RFD25946.1 hypothetical protein MUBE_06975 [Mycobacterium uberis]